MKAVKAVSLSFSVLFVLLAPVALSQETAEGSPAEAYGRFRRWMTEQPRDTPSAQMRAGYLSHLKSQGLSDADIESEIALLDAGGDRAEIEMWNRVLTAEEPFFNTDPNAFLERMVARWKPGKALDVGMGQGRNAVFLAQEGWDVTGFDPADKAVALAHELAGKAGVEIKTFVQTDEEFDFGTEKWDLIVLSYVSARSLVDEVVRSLAPGGLVVLEAFHEDATEGRSIGGAVVYENNELLGLFSELRIIRYEDEMAIADFGQQNVRVVRMAAIKD